MDYEKPSASYDQTSTTYEGAPPIYGQPSATTTITDVEGKLPDGLQFRIDHRDSNSLLQFMIPHGYELKTRSGTLVSMSPSIQVQGKLNATFKNVFSGAQVAQTIFTGPGEVTIAPHIWGDIVPITMDSNHVWRIGKRAFLACTPGITTETKSQGFWKGMKSSEGMFITEATGAGVLWLHAFGAVLKRELGPDEEWIVEHGHLVGWNCHYTAEYIQSKHGLMSRLATEDGFVCRFKGPGTVYLGTRNPTKFVEWINSEVVR